MHQQSIHPRVVGGQTVYAKVNTSKSPNRDVAARKIAAIQAHLERHPHDSLSRNHISLLQAKL